MQTKVAGIDERAIARMKREIQLPDPDQRFSMSGQCRSIPVELASPPPLGDDEKPKYRFLPPPADVPTPRKLPKSAVPGYGIRPASTFTSRLAMEPCRKSGGDHQWLEMPDNLRITCRGCRIRVQKTRVKGLVVVGKAQKRGRDGTLDIRACKQTGGDHRWRAQGATEARCSCCGIRRRLKFLPGGYRGATAACPSGACSRCLPQAVREPGRTHPAQQARPEWSAANPVPALPPEQKCDTGRGRKVGPKMIRIPRTRAEIAQHDIAEMFGKRDTKQARPASVGSVREPLSSPITERSNA